MKPIQGTFRRESFFVQGFRIFRPSVSRILTSLVIVFLGVLPGIRPAAAQTRHIELNDAAGRFPVYSQKMSAARNYPDTARSHLDLVGHGAPSASSRHADITSYPASEVIRRT